MVWLRLLLLPPLVGLAIVAGAAVGLVPGRWRKNVRDRLNRALCRSACALLGLRVSDDGSPPIGRPAILIANHVSWTDVIVLGSIAPICFLARHDVAGWPGLGLLARLFGTLFVERGRLKQIPRVNRAMADRMRAGDLVALFAEATTGDGTRLKRFHAVHLAAARDLLRADPGCASVTVAPTAVVYSHRRGLPLGCDGRARVAWYGDSEFVPHLLDLVRDGGAECRISFLAPIAFTRDSDRKAVTRQSCAVIRTEVARLNAGIRAGDDRPYILSEPQGV